MIVPCKFKKAHTLCLLAFLVFPKLVLSHGGGLNKEGCHNNNKTGEFHCHRDSETSDKSDKKISTGVVSEASFNSFLADYLGGKTEVNRTYNYGLSESDLKQGSIRVDIETDDYVIEGGLDKRTSLDSIQQAIFASSITGKSPGVAIYDTDGGWGKFEHRVWQVAKMLSIRFIWVFKGKVIEQ